MTWTFTYFRNGICLQGAMSLQDLQEIAACLPGTAYSYTSPRETCCTFLNRHRMSHCMDSPTRYENEFVRVSRDRRNDLCLINDDRCPAMVTITTRFTTETTSNATTETPYVTTTVEPTVTNIVFNSSDFATMLVKSGVDIEDAKLMLCESPLQPITVLNTMTSSSASPLAVAWARLGVNVFCNDTTTSGLVTAMREISRLGELPSDVRDVWEGLGNNIEG